MKRNHEIRVRINLNELESIKLKAKKLGLAPSAYLRLLGLNATIEPTNSLKSL